VKLQLFIAQTGETIDIRLYKKDERHSYELNLE